MSHRHNARSSRGWESTSGSNANVVEIKQLSVPHSQSADSDSSSVLRRSFDSLPTSHTSRKPSPNSTVSSRPPLQEQHQPQQHQQQSHQAQQHQPHQAQQQQHQQQQHAKRLPEPPKDVEPFRPQKSVASQDLRPSQDVRVNQGQFRPAPAVQQPNVWQTKNSSQDIRQQPDNVFRTPAPVTQRQSSGDRNVQPVRRSTEDRSRTSSVTSQQSDPQSQSRDFNNAGRDKRCDNNNREYSYNDSYDSRRGKVEMNPQFVKLMETLEANDIKMTAKWTSLVNSRMLDDFDDYLNWPRFRPGDRIWLDTSKHVDDNTMMLAGQLGSIRESTLVEQEARKSQQPRHDRRPGGGFGGGGGGGFGGQDTIQPVKSHSHKLNTSASNDSQRAKPSHSIDRSFDSSDRRPPPRNQTAASERSASHKEPPYDRSGAGSFNESQYERYPDKCNKGKAKEEPNKVNTGHEKVKPSKRRNMARKLTSSSTANAWDRRSTIADRDRPSDRIDDQPPSRHRPSDRLDDQPPSRRTAAPHSVNVDPDRGGSNRKTLPSVPSASGSYPAPPVPEHRRVPSKHEDRLSDQPPVDRTIKPFTFAAAVKPSATTVGDRDDDDGGGSDFLMVFGEPADLSQYLREGFKNRAEYRKALLKLTGVGDDNDQQDAPCPPPERRTSPQLTDDHRQYQQSTLPRSQHHQQQQQHQQLQQQQPPEVSPNQVELWNQAKLETELTTASENDEDWQKVPTTGRKKHASADKNRRR